MLYLPVLDVIVDGTTTNLLNNCRTLATLDQVESTNWVKTNICQGDECCPECIPNEFSGVPCDDGTWWFDKSNVDAESFYGWIVREVELEPAMSERRSGDSTIEPVEYSPRRLEVSVTALAADRRGVFYGIAKMNAFVESLCDEFTVRLQAFCQDSPTTILPDPAIVPAPVLIASDCGPCKDAAVAPEVGGAPSVRSDITDNGARNLFKARFLAFDADGEVDEKFPACVGYDAVLVFDIYDDSEWGDPVENICTFPIRPAPKICRTLDWNAWCRQVPSRTSCVLATTSTTTDLLRKRTPREWQFTQPLAYHLEACLLERLPFAGDVGFGLKIQSGSAELHNYAFEILEVVEHWPRPDTCEGERLYDTLIRDLRGFVPYLPAQSTLTLSAERDLVTVECPGAALPSETSIEEWDGGTLDPTKRYWIISRFDCYLTADDVVVTPVITPRYV